MATYDPWVGGHPFRLDPPTLAVTLAWVGDAGWVARLACRAFGGACRRVAASSVDSPERLELARSARGWVEPDDLCQWAAGLGCLEILK